jgi:hypothetical protein
MSYDYTANNTKLDAFLDCSLFGKSIYVSILQFSIPFLSDFGSDVHCIGGTVG